MNSEQHMYNGRLLVVLHFSFISVYFRLYIGDFFREIPHNYCITVLIDAKCLVFPQQRVFDIGAKFLVFPQQLRCFDGYEAKFVVSNATPTSKWIPSKY